jgi:hypothetical protein
VSLKLLDISKVICIVHILEYNYLLGHWAGEYLNYFKLFIAQEQEQLMAKKLQNDGGNT